MINHSAFVHPMAHVDRETCAIGAGTKVWQFASIIRHAVLGEDCNVASCAIIDGAVLGDRCLVGHGCSINPGFKAGNDVFIGPSVTICNDVWPEVGKEGFDLDLLRSGKFWAVIVGDGASIGARAVLLPGVRIGAGAVVAAGAVVCRDVPDGALWRRDGSVEAVPADRREKRMRLAT